MVLVKAKNKESAWKDFVLTIIAPFGLLFLALAVAVPALLNNDLMYALAKFLLVIGMIIVAFASINLILSSRLDLRSKFIGAALVFVVFFLVTIAGFRLLNYSQEKNATHLFPGDAPDPVVATCKSVPEGAFKTFLGSNESWSTSFPHTILQMGHQNMLVIDRSKSGSIQIKTIEIFDKDGISIASFHDNNIWSSPIIRSEKKDKSTYVVYGKTSDKIMEIRLINKESLVVTGLFFKPGVAPVLATESDLYVGSNRISNSCLGGASVDLAVN